MSASFEAGRGTSTELNDGPETVFFVDLVSMKGKARAQSIAVVRVSCASGSRPAQISPSATKVHLYL